TAPPLGDEAFGPVDPVEKTGLERLDVLVVDGLGLAQIPLRALDRAKPRDELCEPLHAVTRLPEGFGRLEDRLERLTQTRERPGAERLAHVEEGDVDLVLG